MHRMQSGGIQKSVELFFVQLSFVRRSYVAIDRHVLSTRACARAHTEALEVPEVLLIRHKANSVRQTVRV